LAGKPAFPEDFAGVFLDELVRCDELAVSVDPVHTASEVQFFGHLHLEDHLAELYDLPSLIPGLLAVAAIVVRASS